MNNVKLKIIKMKRDKIEKPASKKYVSCFPKTTLPLLRFVVVVRMVENDLISSH